MVVVHLEQLQGTHKEARTDGPSQTTFVGCWWHTKMYSPMCCSKQLLPKNGKQLCSTKDWVLGLCGNNWSWSMDIKMVKAIQEEKWTLPKKGLRSLIDLAKYYHRFIRDFSKVARTYSTCLEKNGYPINGMNFVTKPWWIQEQVLFARCSQVSGFSQAFWGAYEGVGPYHRQMLMQDEWPLHIRALRSMIVRPCLICERYDYPKSGMSLVSKSLGSLKPSSLLRPLTKLFRCIRGWVHLSLAGYWCKMDGHCI